jgi:hypothetical protein
MFGACVYRIIGITHFSINSIIPSVSIITKRLIALHAACHVAAVTSAYEVTQRKISVGPFIKQHDTEMAEAFDAEFVVKSFEFYCYFRVLPNGVQADDEILVKSF